MRPILIVGMILASLAAPAVAQQRLSPNPPALMAITEPDLPAFLDIVDEYAARYDRAPHDLARGPIRNARADAICSLLAGCLTVRNWPGNVVRLSSTADGQGVLHVRLDGRAHLVTMSSTIGDNGFGTLIAHGSRLYEQAVALRIGQRVRFSGTFFAHGNDCVRELSATSGGSLRAPEFAFRFTEIRPDR